jgi:hypothetical protein
LALDEVEGAGHDVESFFEVLESLEILTSPFQWCAWQIAAQQGSPSLVVL